MGHLSVSLQHFWESWENDSCRLREYSNKSKLKCKVFRVGGRRMKMVKPGVHLNCNYSYSSLRNERISKILGHPTSSKNGRFSLDGDWDQRELGAASQDWQGEPNFPPKRFSHKRIWCVSRKKTFCSFGSLCYRQQTEQNTVHDWRVIKFPLFTASINVNWIKRCTSQSPFLITRRDNSKNLREVTS